MEYGTNDVIATLKEDVLSEHVVLEKLKVERKGILKDAFIIIAVALVIIVFGLYVHYAEWTDYPIIPFLIFAVGILLAVALRPVQRLKKELERTEKRINTMKKRLYKSGYKYEVTIQVEKNSNGEFDVKKHIQLHSIQKKSHV